MGSHDHFRAGFNSRPERNQFHVVEFLECFFHSGKSCVAVYARIAVAGEMLQHRNSTVFTHTLVKGLPIIRHCFGIIRKCTHPDDGIIRIIIYIQHYTEIRIDREQREFLRYFFTGLPGILDVSRRRDSHIARPLCTLSKAVYNTSLLVNSHEEGDYIL